MSEITTSTPEITPLTEDQISQLEQLKTDFDNEYDNLPSTISTLESYGPAKIGNTLYDERGGAVEYIQELAKKIREEVGDTYTIVDWNREARKLVKDNFTYVEAENPAQKIELTPHAERELLQATLYYNKLIADKKTPEEEIAFHDEMSDYLDIEDQIASAKEDTSSDTEHGRAARAVYKITEYWERGKERLNIDAERSSKIKYLMGGIAVGAVLGISLYRAYKGFGTGPINVPDFAHDGSAEQGHTILTNEGLESLIDEKVEARLDEANAEAIEEYLDDHGLDHRDIDEASRDKIAEQEAAADAAETEEAEAEALETLSGEFDVNAKHGYTNELQEAVKSAYGIELSGEEAWRLHQELVDNVGRDYINMVDFKGDDVYSMGSGKYEIGLSSAGKAEWDDRAVEYIHNKFGAPVEATVDAEAVVPSAEPPVAEKAPESPSTVNPFDDNLEIPGGSGALDTPASSNINPFDDNLEIPKDSGVFENGATKTITEQHTMNPFDDNLEIPSATTDSAVEPSDNPTSSATPSPFEAEATLAEDTKLTGLEAMKEADANGTDGIVWEDAKMHAQNMHDYLQAGNIDLINDDYSLQRTLQYIQKDIGDMTYPGTETKILELQNSNVFGGRWVFNENPTGNGVPAEVIALFDKYANAL